MDRLQNLVSVTNRGYQDTCDDVKAKILLSLNKIGDVISDMVEKIPKTSALLNDRVQVMSSIHDKDRISLEEAVQVRGQLQNLSVALVNNSEGTINTVENHTECIVEQLHKIVDTISQQRSEVEDLVMKQNEFANKINQMRGDAFSDGHCRD